MAEAEKKEAAPEPKAEAPKAPVAAPAAETPHTTINVNTASPVAGSVKEVNWILTLIMSILFGTLGVDRFIMGQIGMGILKIVVGVLTLGIGGAIWWVIDVILIATKHPFPGVKWVD